MCNAPRVATRTCHNSKSFHLSARNSRIHMRNSLLYFVLRFCAQSTAGGTDSRGGDGGNSNDFVAFRSAKMRACMRLRFCRTFALLTAEISFAKLFIFIYFKIFFFCFVPSQALTRVAFKL